MRGFLRERTGILVENLMGMEMKTGSVRNGNVNGHCYADIGGNGNQKPIPTDV